MVLQADLNQFVNSYDRFFECERRLLGHSTNNVFEVPTQEKLREIALAAKKTIRRTKLGKDTTVFAVEYRGIHFVHTSTPEPEVAA